MESNNLDTGFEESPKINDNDQSKILHEFVEKIGKQQDMPSEFKDILNEHFWDLL